MQHTWYNCERKPSPGKGGEGKDLPLPSNFLASCNREYCSSRWRINTLMDWKFGYSFSYLFFFFFPLYVPLATPCPSLWDGNQIINSLFKIWNFFQITESDCQRHFILMASIWQSTWALVCTQYSCETKEISHIFKCWIGMYLLGEN